jgi:hypothetical protein
MQGFPSRPKGLHKRLPLSSRIFTGMQHHLDHLQTYFSGEHRDDAPKSFALHGLRGAGKTQIAAKFTAQQKL